jgi:hypothetical protein
MPSEDITFCANKYCEDMGCYRNSKNIKRHDILHSFSLFTQCPKWDDKGAEWLIKQIPEWTNLEV